MTWGFFYLLALLGGLTLALVTGLVRRLVHPSELCDGVVHPSAEHWSSQHAPKSDFAISFLTLFGLTTFAVHGLTSFGPLRELAIGFGGGIVGVVLIRMWMGHISDPIHQVEGHPDQAIVVRDIPANGFGQVEVTVSGARLKLAAKSSGDAIPEGTVVQILNRQESVVVVEPVAG